MEGIKITLLIVGVRLFGRSVTHAGRSTDFVVQKGSGFVIHGPNISERVGTPRWMAQIR